MGYQAFLFCVDEKLARVVSQLFSELEFSVTSLHDPFAAVKSLMAQHYDAIVLDCENEQSASLLIKSARNSTVNQGSLAIALVEGQAGVAKAYRMGANLVLTKPINVEQAKGTLRVARGLLRKGSEAATHAPSAAPDKPSAPAAFPPAVPAHQYEESTAAHTARNADPRYESHDSSGTIAPATHAPAFAKSEEAPAHAPAAQTKAWTALAGQAPFVQPLSAAAPIPAAQPSPQRPVSERVAIKADAPKPAVMPFVNATPKSHGAASAPAPAKEVLAPAQPAHDTEDREEFPEDAPFHATEAASFLGAGEASAGPLFSAGAEQTGGSGGSQKILIGAVAVFLLIAAYFGWTKFGPSHSTSAPATSVAATPQTPPQAPSNVSSAPAAQAPSAAANHTTATTAPGHTTSSVQPEHSTADASPTTQTVAVSESTATKTAPSPILVKSGPAKPRQTQPPSQTEDASAQPPSALGIVSPGEGNLSGVLTANAAKPTLARVRISQGVSQGLLIKQVPPKYPSNAIAMRAQGAVQIEATVDKEGRVVNPKVISGSALLAPAALEAVRQWRYKPYYLDGEPVEIQTQITINFKTQ